MGFLQHLNTRPGGTVLTEAIVTESRQQFAFRQLSGYQAIDVRCLLRVAYLQTLMRFADLVRPRYYACHDVDIARAAH